MSHYFNEKMPCSLKSSRSSKERHWMTAGECILRAYVASALQDYFTGKCVRILKLRSCAFEQAWTQTDTERQTTDAWRRRKCKPAPSGAFPRILCARCWLSAAHWSSSAALGPGQRTRNLRRHIRAGPERRTRNSPWGRRQWLSHTGSLGESP